MGRILFLAFLVSAISACVQTNPEPPSPSDPQPRPTKIPSMNLTACSGYESMLPLPSEYVRTKIPGDYRTYDQLPMETEASYRMLDCQKVAPDGRDAGRTVLSLLMVPVRAPPAYQPAPGSGYSMFVFAIGAADPQVREFLKNMSLAPSIPQFSKTRAPLPGNSQQIRIESFQDGGGRCVGVAVGNTEVESVPLVERWFFFAKAADGYANVTGTSTRSMGDGQGALECDADSQPQKFLGLSAFDQFGADLVNQTLRIDFQVRRARG